MQIFSFVSEPSFVAELQKSCAQLSIGGDLRAFEKPLHANPGARLGDVAGLVLLDCTQAPEDELGAFEKLAISHPKLRAIMVVAEEKPELLLRGMRAGVREVLKSSASATDLAEALVRVMQIRVQVPASASGRVLAFTACKAGSGVSFLAANLGYLLASEQNKKVLLIDLDLQFGDALFLVTNTKPVATVTDVVQDIQRVDEAYLRSSVVQVSPNFSILTGPGDLGEAGRIRANDVEQLLRLVKPLYDIVLLDIGETFGNVANKAMSLADEIFNITQPSVVHVRSSRRLLNLFTQLGYPQAKIKTLLNRTQGSGRDITVGDVAEALRCQVYASIPQDEARMMAAMNQGVPIATLYPGSPITRALRDLAQNLTDTEAVMERGWLSRMLRRA